ncbi:glutathione S-transferase 1-1-like [Uranotaenia lowii]|uniref:glutathione S-transferase 1-1-like n=1 Tax=Uranotaenia lowii TaxID=190385 RepID=UPI0024789192|nr:glutathione S-transferase 1-1-like [Uranotaenia lowii]
MPITLYYYPMGPPARAIILLIKELGLNVQLKVVDLQAGETRTEEFLKMNPQHTVPTLDDNGFYLWESRAILAYLVETYSPGHTLYPTIPRERAAINRILHHDLSTLYAHTTLKLMPIWMRQTTVVSEDMKKEFYEALEKLERYLIRNEWFAGENITLADISLLPTIASMVHTGVDFTRFPRLAAWYENCKILKGYEEDQQVAEQAGAYFKSLVTEGF